MFYVFLADGFEEIEALAPVDFLRRAGIEVKTAAVRGKSAVGSHGIPVLCDIGIDELCLDESLLGVLLPGGMPGATHLNESAAVKDAVRFAYEKGAAVCAICAAPFILGEMDLLNGKKATCFPGFEDKLTGARLVQEGVVSDGNVITACGAGVAWEFAAEIAARFVGKAAAERLLESIQWRR